MLKLKVRRIAICLQLVLEGEMPSKQEKMVLGWAAFHQTELMENWELAVKHMELFSIDPLQ